MWIYSQPKQNIWVTLAKTLQQDSLCMSMGSVNDPLSTCLVRIPLTTNDYPYTGKKPNPVDAWDEMDQNFATCTRGTPRTGLIGSSQAMCWVQFLYREAKQALDI